MAMMMMMLLLSLNDENDADYDAGTGGGADQDGGRTSRSATFCVQFGQVYLQYYLQMLNPKFSWTHFANHLDFFSFFIPYSFKKEYDVMV